jgi:hypothetical protein
MVILITVILKVPTFYVCCRLVVVVFFLVIFPLMGASFIYKELSRSGPVSHDYINWTFIFQTIQYSLKTLYIAVAAGRFRSLLLDLESFHCNSHLGDEAKETLRSQAASLLRLFRGLRILCFVTYVFWILLPGITSKSAANKDLPFKYPFSTDYFPVNLFILALETLCAYTALSLCADNILIHVAIILMLCCQFKVLKSSAKGDQPLPLHLFIQDHVKLIK